MLLVKALAKVHVVILLCTVAFAITVVSACQRDSGQLSRSGLADYPLLPATEENLSHVTTLRADSGEHVLGEMFVVSPWHEGYVAASADRSKLLLFDASGRLQKVSGASGSGPGEWQRIAMLVADPDGELLVLERPRYNRLDNELRWIDSFLGATLDCQQVLKDDTLLCTTNTGVGPTWLRMASNGDTLARGGPSRLAVGTPCAFCEAAVLHDHSAGDSLTFVAISHRLVQRVGAALQEVAPLEFPLPQQGAIHEAAQLSENNDAPEFALPRRVRAHGGWRLSSGEVTIVFSAPATGTEGARAQNSRPSASQAGRTTLDAMRRFSTVVLTVDRAGRPLSQMEFAGERVLPVGPGLLARARYDAAGFVEIEILRVLSESHDTVFSRHRSIP